MSVYAILIFSSLIYLATGLLCKHHSSYPDVTVGYHSKFAQKSNSTWLESNMYVGKLLTTISIIELILCAVFRLFFIPVYAILFFVLLTFPLTSIIATELHLRVHFNADGTKRG
ncbi:MULTISPECIES: SdpI family protein [Clostridium]|uniref:SdpI family protein n=1 Tax=Clostridium TaxID=1485 RepID=UPI0008240920|nr:MULTISPECIES: SdpI family protein [Clostridium]PJI07467.1 hypothetical protein CUB90_06145 [Clostridium sp. CT7]